LKNISFKKYIEQKNYLNKLDEIYKISNRKEERKRDMKSGGLFVQNPKNKIRESAKFTQSVNEGKLNTGKYNKNYFVNDKFLKTKLNKELNLGNKSEILKRMKKSASKILIKEIKNS